MRLATLSLLLAVVGAQGLSGCGARTGLGVDEIAVAVRDAGVPTPARDAGSPFFTFPCRWTLGGETILARAPTPLRDVIAAVPLRDDVALAMVGDVTGSTGYRGAIVALADPPTILRPISHDRGGQVIGLDDGFGQLEIGSAGCSLAHYDGTFSRTARSVPLAPSSACQLERRDARVLEVTYDDGRAVVLGAVALSPGASVPAQAPIASSSIRGASYDPRYGWMALSMRGAGSLELDRVPLAGMRDVVRLEVGARRFAIEPDRLRIGVLVLRENPTGAERLERLAPDRDAPAFESLLDVSAIGASNGELASTEAEGGIPLRDGRIVFVPTSGTPPAVIGPVTSSPPDELHLAFRAGTSVGVAAYTYRDAPTGENRLALRVLTCNR